MAPGQLPSLPMPKSGPASDHILVRVNISLAILRELPQCQRVCHFTQADWQGLQTAISLQDWSPISTTPDANSVWEFFHRNLLCLMPSHLQLSYSSSHPWYTESCGEAVTLKQLAFSSWKANLTKGNLSEVQKVVQQVCVDSQESQKITSVQLQE